MKGMDGQPIRPEWRQFPGTLEHVRKGGLLLRPRSNREPVYHRDEEAAP